MSSSIIDSLQADKLLSGTPVLSQIESIKKQLQYETDDKVVSFPDHLAFLQEGIESIGTLKLLDRVPPGCGPKYENDLLSYLEEIQDAVERWKIKVIRFQGDVLQAESRVQELRAAFESWYYLAAIDVLEAANLVKRFPATSIKSLATSEFNRLMDRSNLSLDALNEVLKVEIKRLDSKHKMARTKFDMGRDQVNTAMLNTLPETLGISPAPRFPLLSTNSFDPDEENLVPSFVSRDGHVVEASPAPEESRLPDEPSEASPDKTITLSYFSSGAVGEMTVVKPSTPARMTYFIGQDLAPHTEEIGRSETVTPIGVAVKRGFFKTGDAFPVTVVEDPEIEEETSPARHIELEPDVEREEARAEVIEEEACTEVQCEEEWAEAEQEDPTSKYDPEEVSEIEEELAEEAMFEASLAEEQVSAPAMEDVAVLDTTLPVSTEVAVEAPVAEDTPKIFTSTVSDLSDFDLDDFASPVIEAPVKVDTPVPTVVLPEPVPESKPVVVAAPSSTRKPMNFDFDDDDL